MRKIIAGAMVSMDGIMQAPGGPTEDPTKGFESGGWVMPYLSQEFGEEINHVFEEEFDLLLGRKTYEIFAAYWLRDIAAVKRLKQEDGPNLVTQGSSELVHALLADDLVDAMSIFTVPVVLGSGKKLFADGSAPHSFKLARSRVSQNGLIMGHYEREGEIKIGDTAFDAPSDREVARQERMKREG